ncbi:MAG: hypothetical protein L3K11_07500 [Thermoplasmata archaeon]|nr:hypothetical protein [Thermoplasmata archaeon]
MTVRAARSESRPRRLLLRRLLEVLTGLVVVGVAIVILANPATSLAGLIELLAVALGVDALRVLARGGIDPGWVRRVEDRLEGGLGWLGQLGRLGLGVVVVAVALAVLLFPQARQLTLLYLLAFGIVVMSVERISSALGPNAPTWFRASAAGVGVIAILFVLGAVLSPLLGLATVAILLAVSLLLSGIQSVVSGLHPTDPRQVVLLKVVLFSLLYGLVLINWIDLFGKTVPGYGLWLILTYFAPFWMMLVYEGFSEWPLAVTLGLLVSLANDVGYFFVGNLLFGFNVNLGPWIAGQLGLQGSTIVTTFQGGSFVIPVSSLLMGLSIYARIVAVSLGLYYWWTHPSRIVARRSGGPPGSEIPS